MLVQRPGEGILETVALPGDCTPARLFDAGGLAVLTCQVDDDLGLFVRESGGTWRREASFPKVRARDLVSHSVTDDGTIVLHGRCAPDLVTPCAASLMRAPVGGEGGKSWHRLDLPNITLARPLPGGQAIVVTAVDASTEQATVWRVGEGGAKKLVELTGIEGALRDVRVAPDGTLTARVGDTFTPATFTVTRGGALVARTTKTVPSQTSSNP